MDRITGPFVLALALCACKGDERGGSQVPVANASASTLPAKQEALRTDDIREGLRELESVCGFDLINAIASVVGSHGAWQGVPEAVTITRLAEGITRAQLTTCLTKAGAKWRGMELHAHTEDLYTFRTSENWYALEFLDDATILTVVGPRVTTARITELHAGTGLRWSAAFSGLVATLDVRAPAWAVMELHAKPFEKLRADAKAVSAKLSLADRMRFEFRARMPSSVTAAERVQFSPEALTRALGFSIDGFEVTSDGPDVVVTASPSRAQFAKVAALFRAFVHES